MIVNFLRSFREYNHWLVAITCGALSLSGAVLAGRMTPAQYSFAAVFDDVVNSEQIRSRSVSHVVFGSDSPPVPLPLARAVDTVKQLKISEEDKQKIFGDNAAKLLKLAG